MITLDLPMPPSTNRIWRVGKRSIYKSQHYVRWCEQADLAILAEKAYPKHKISGPFKAQILLSTGYRGDGDNRIKACLDYLESRDIVRNDADCISGAWSWVEPEMAPRGCRVTLWELGE